MNFSGNFPRYRWGLHIPPGLASRCEMTVIRLKIEAMPNPGTRSPRKVLVIATGGTFEKVYDEAQGKIENRESILEGGIVRKLRLPHSAVEVMTIMNKDSLDMDDADRARVVAEILKREAEDAPIIVVHGTDTVDRTARRCCEEIRAPRVAVVFTGAMKPVGFEDSDARQNFTEALMAARLLPPGFYLSFHGEVYRAPHFTKNRELGTFEALPGGELPSPRAR